MAITLTPLMQLPVPGVGTEQGPNYATDINNCLTLIDAHDHSPNYGTPINPAGMNINADLSFGGNNATTIRTVRLSPQGSVPAGAADFGCLFELGVDLYFKDGSGNSVRLTQSGGVAALPGSITNLALPASASFSGAAKTFTFQSASLTPGNIDAGSYILRNIVASSFGLTLSPPTLATDTSITLPAIPASTLPLTISNAGVMTAGQIVLAQLTAAVQSAIAQGQAAYTAITPPATILMYGGTTAPAGYLLCDGSAVSRTTYAALYAAIGNASGAGDGSTTFNVPDTRGLFVRGVTGASASDPDTLTRTAAASGGNTGNSVGSVQADAFQTHYHTLTSGTGGTGATPASATGSLAASSGDTFHTPANGNYSSETRPKNVYLNYIIKT